MSHILFMRLAGPMQSWGVMSRFSRRDTGKEPSKSGVTGIICAAMGISREDDQHPDFLTLITAKLGIRVLRGGVLQSDYHTAQDVAIANAEPRKDGTYKTKDTELSTRFYLADADFVAALEADDHALLEKIHAALKAPHWQLFLGRKAFVPHL
ncbi:MAG: type I-E CRISPR-associated protein Cas5/CasD, partial [Acidobacteriota bacterium]